VRLGISVGGGGAVTTAVAVTRRRQWWPKVVVVRQCGRRKKVWSENSGTCVEMGEMERPVAGP
jgi:hypothetical protein